MAKKTPLGFMRRISRGLRAAVSRVKAAIARIKRPDNVRLVVAVGDYKGRKSEKFDIIIERVMSRKEYETYTSGEGLLGETVDQAISLLRDRGQFGLAAMIEANDKVSGLEATDTRGAAHPVEFTRFKIRGVERLAEIKRKREVPDRFRKHKQAKI